MTATGQLFFSVQQKITENELIETHCGFVESNACTEAVIDDRNYPELLLVCALEATQRLDLPLAPRFDYGVVPSGRSVLARIHFNPGEWQTTSHTHPSAITRRVTLERVD